MYRLRCFGTMALENREGAGLELRSRKHSALLLYLLGHRGRVFPRERLAALFWETEPRLARHSLSQALYDIRRTLPGVEFDATTSQVGAGADRIAYDGERLEEAVRANELGRAVRLYDGRFAPDVEDVGNPDFTRWVEAERQRYRRLAEMALYRHVRASRDRADWGEMCVSALRLLEMNPLSEDAHRALMRGLWLQGDRASAVRHFENVREFLAREVPGGVSRETLDLVERIRASRPTGPASSGADEQRVEMVGREAEFEGLQRALDELRGEGRGGLVRVHGEAGMGKTRLLEEFRGLAALDGARVLTSQCYAAESDVPYGPVVDGLSELAEEAARRVGEEGELPYFELGHLFPETFDRPAEPRDAFAEPQAGRRRLYEEAADLLRRASEHTAVVWLVEDVHWIDSSSASLLHYVARRLADRPLLLVVTARTHEETTGAARDLLEDEGGSIPRVVDFRLSALDRDETTRLAEAVLDAPPDPDTAGRIHELAGGNPFYALELLRSVAGADEAGSKVGAAPASTGLITKSLKALLERRLRGLAPEAVRILETVAVAGRHATPRVVAQVTDFPPDRLADIAGTLYGRGLLRDGDGRLEFSHAITEDFVYGNMGDLQRSALHRTVGELLADEEGTADPATLARHFKEGGEAGLAYDYALQAAQEAERRHAHEEAIQMAEMAIAVATNGHEKRVALQVAAECRLSVGDFPGARANLLEVLNSKDDLSSADRSQVHVSLARVSVELGYWDEAIMQIRGLSEPGPNISPQMPDYLAAGFYEWVKAGIKANRPDEVNEAVNAIKKVIERNGADRVAGGESRELQLSLAAYNMFCQSAKKGLAQLEGIEDAATLTYHTTTQISLLKTLLYARLGRWEESERAAAEGLRMSSQRNDFYQRLLYLDNLSVCYFERGLWKETQELRNEAAKARRALHGNGDAFSKIRAEDYEGNIAFFQGQLSEAREHLRQAIKVADSIDQPQIYTAEIRATLGLVAAQLGNIDDAVKLREEMSSVELLNLPRQCGIQDRYKVAWLAAYCRWLENDRSIAGMLRAMSEVEEKVDVVSAARMNVLASGFEAITKSGVSEEGVIRDHVHSCEAATRLREMDMGWFPYVVRRWFRGMNCRK